MHKNRSRNFARSKGSKTRKGTRKNLKKAKPGAFWVLEGMRAGEDGSKRMGKPATKAIIFSTDLSRLPPRSVRGRAPLALAHPTTRTARGVAAPCSQDIPPTNEKSQVPQMRYLTFWQGQKDLNPRHAVLEWMWESAPGSKRTMLLTDFSRQAQKSWCWFGAEKVADGILRNRNDIFTKHL